MKERAHTFGSHQGLVGITCEPDAGPGLDLPGFIFFNIGLNHRVGPHRVQVELARALAVQGFASLRFDLSGLGDSAPRGDSRAEAERVVLDLQEAMNLLAEKSAAKRFVLLGLCSGVDGVYAVSGTDPRVAGAVHIDGYAYADDGYRRRQRRARLRHLFRLSRWRAALARRIRRARGWSLEKDAETAAPEPIFDRTYPPLEDFRSALERQVAHGTRLLFIYTRGAPFFDRRDQFASMLGWRTLPAGIEVEHWPDCDHVFTSRAMRRQLIDRVRQWAGTQFGTAVPPATTPPG